MYGWDHRGDSWVWEDGFHVSDPGRDAAKLRPGQGKIRKIWWLHFAFEILYDTGIVLVETLLATMSPL